MNESFDQQMKLIVIGNASVGKTSLLYRFIEGRTKKNSTYTIGVEFAAKIVESEKNKTKYKL